MHFPKIIMKSFEEIFTYERLYQSFTECKKGQMWKSSVIEFNANYAERLLKLEQLLQGGTYQALPDNITFIHERGKRRMIHSQHIRDRVVHKVVNQEILIPIFHKRFIRQNTASQKGKGMDFALRTFKCHLNRAYRKWGKDFYVLSIDIRKFFESISHEYIEKLLQEEIEDERILRLCTEVMRTYGGSQGLGLGSELNQTYALLCLDELDHIMKEKFRIKEYGRYMDDMYLFHNDKEYLKEIVAFTGQYLDGIGMRMNEKKTSIFPVKNGISFLGFRWKLTDTGHVLVVPRKQTITRNKRKLRKLKKKLEEGVFTFPEVYNSYASMRGHLKRCNCKRVIRDMDTYFNKLFIESWVNEYERERITENEKSAVRPE